MPRPPPSPPSISPPSSPSAAPTPSPSPSALPSRSRPQMHLTIPPSPPFNPIKPVPHPLTNPPSPPPPSPPLMSPAIALPFPHLPHRSPPKRAHRPRHSERRPSPLHRTYSARDLAQLTESDEEGEGEAAPTSNTESSDASNRGDGEGEGKGKGSRKWNGNGTGRGKGGRDGDGGPTRQEESGGMEWFLQRFTFEGRNLHRGGFAGGKEGAKVIVLNDSESDDEVEPDTPTKRSSSATRARGRGLSPSTRGRANATKGVREARASGWHSTAVPTRIASMVSMASIASMAGWWHASQVVGWGIAIVLALVQVEEECLTNSWLTVASVLDACLVLELCTRLVRFPRSHWSPDLSNDTIIVLFGISLIWPVHKWPCGEDGLWAEEVLIASILLCRNIGRLIDHQHPAAGSNAGKFRPA